MEKKRALRINPIELNSKQSPINPASKAAKIKVIYHSYKVLIFTKIK